MQCDCYIYNHTSFPKSWKPCKNNGAFPAKFMIYINTVVYITSCVLPTESSILWFLMESMSLLKQSRMNSLECMM